VRSERFSVWLGGGVQQDTTSNLSLATSKRFDFEIDARFKPAEAVPRVIIALAQVGARHLGGLAASNKTNLSEEGTARFFGRFRSAFAFS
jgi:hypothetical protein